MMWEGIKGPALLGDIGATNARFALLDATGIIGHIRVTACAQHPGLAEAAEVYLKEIGAHETVRAAAIDVAGPVSGDRVTLTNHPWGFSQAELRTRLGLDHLLIVNDFAAAAAAAPHLAMSELGWIGTQPAPTLYVPETPIGVIGPGSGLGVGSILPVGEGRWIALAGEGGHVSLAPGTEREGRVWNAMRERFGHVSSERALSGPGLVNLYSFLAEIDGKTVQPRTPAEVSEAGLAGTDPYCVEALAMFAELLGSVAGDLALTLGARGGVYIAGGIVPRYGKAFPAARFRARFEGKGRLCTYLVGIPTFVMLHPFPAFVGLAALLRGGSAIAG
jgi:glucokinase